MGKKKKERVLDLEDSIQLEDMLEKYGVIFEPEGEVAEQEKTKRPDSVRIFGRNYSFNYVPEYMGLAEMGTTDNHNLLINIKEHQLPVEEADTVLHEVIHAIEYTMDLEMSEHQVRALATGLMGVFQDNPKFAKYIIEPKSTSTVSVERG